jgi:hypothetical protein
MMRSQISLMRIFNENQIRIVHAGEPDLISDHFRNSSEVLPATSIFSFLT